MTSAPYRSTRSRPSASFRLPSSQYTTVSSYAWAGGRRRYLS